MSEPNDQAQDSKSAPPPSPPPPKGPGWITLAVFIFAVIVSAAIGVVAAQKLKAPPSQADMDVTMRQLDRLLAEKAIDEASYAQVAQVVKAEQERIAAEVVDEDQFYTCGMHPWVILPKPGDCPICHMVLTPIDPDKFSGELVIDPVIVQNIGVRIAPVTRGPLTRTIRTVGVIAYDETSVRDVNIKVSGWIDKLYVDYLGVEVTRGQPLFDIYSPQLYVAQEEYLLAWKNRDKIKAPFAPAAAKGAADLLEAQRTKLEFYDISDEQIAALESAGKPSKNMTLVSPHSGTVIAKHATEGMKVTPGMRVYRIADLSRVWVMVTLYEYQVPFVSLGQRAVMSLSYIPGQTFEGKVVYIYPYLENKSRQVKVRLQFDNPGRLLKPGMYTKVELHSTLAEQRTLVQRAAVIDTGTRQIVIMSMGEGRFERRDVRMGLELDNGQVEILDGLKPGELVVTSGQFLLDSEANIRDGLKKMIKGEMASDQKVAAAVAGASELNALPTTAAAALGEALDGYFAIAQRLADDTTEGLDAPARQVAAAVDALLQVPIPDNPRFWDEHQEAATVRAKALGLVGETDLAGARLKFADLSVALSKLSYATGIPPSYTKKRGTVLEMHCPDYRKSQGGSIWLQPDGDVRNPFFGESMLTCADSRKALPTTGGPPTSQPATSQPATSQPATSQPATSQPATSQPATTQPAPTQPAEL